ncbi:MAG: hypothetical protein E6Q97_06095 [Desulfurellales bacterium]|nr:MAG: hypothetical protein E6Q97_06095 [Desulfurellales bacterium]
MSQPTPDRLQALAEMDALVLRARAAGDRESLLIADVVEAEAMRLRACAEPRIPSRTPKRGSALEHWNNAAVEAQRNARPIVRDWPRPCAYACV